MPKDLVEELDELRLMLEKANTERWVWLKHNSEHGENCGYAMKAKEIFENFHAEEIQNKLESIVKIYY